MFTLRYRVQTPNQTEEGGEPTGSLMLTPITDPVATADGTATASRALSPAPARPSRQSVIPVSGIPLDDLLAENLKLGDTVTITVVKEQV